jgi:methyltransferase (TIGR00027 family)
MQEERSERESSRTAVGVAALRAAHQWLDEEPRILDDPIAPRLLEGPVLERLQAHPERLQSPGATALRSHVVLRSRYAEDRLALAASRGVRQYVILGADMDTFAYRQPEWARPLRIFEMDHPGSQAEKRERLAGAGIEPPPNLCFVCLDFRDGLARGGVDLSQPTLFSWLGVMMYLRMEAVEEVFRTVARMPAGSEIVFSFAQPEPPDGPDGASRLAEQAAALGEPWLTRIEPEDLQRKLHALGFWQVGSLSSEEAAAYFQNRRDRLMPPRRTALGFARL